MATQVGEPMRQAGGILGQEPGAAEAASSPTGVIDRRRLLGRGAAGAAAALGGMLLLGDDAEAARKKKKKKKKCPSSKAVDILKDSGVGTYTDASVANQVSAFTLNRSMVSCAVGTASGPAGTPSGGGPFAMLMYALTIDMLLVDRANGLLRATGRMRSITEMGGQVVEDTEHDYIAVARDGRGNTEDRFDVHFTTPFWTPGSNAMATPSSDYPGKARFGGEMLAGEINVSR